MTKWIIAGGISISLLYAVSLLLSSSDQEAENVVVHRGASISPPPPKPLTLETTEKPTAAANDEMDELPEEDQPSEEITYDLDPAAIEAMRHARLHGDPRTPPIERKAERELPTEKELADPELYAAYEMKQKKYAYRMYVEASKQKISEIEKMIAEGKEQGVSEEEIEFAQNKIKGIQEMAEQLQKEYPEIMSDEYLPQSAQQDDWLAPAE